MVFYPETPEDTQAIVQWVEDHIDGLQGLGKSQALAVIVDGKIVAGAVYNNYRRTTIEITFASVNPRWATRDSIRRILGYPFDQLKVKRITAIVKTRNKRAQKLLKGIGFMREGKIHDCFEDGHGYLYGMTRRYFMEHDNG